MAQSKGETVIQRIVRRRAEIPTHLYELWLVQMGYKRRVNFWEEYR
jgi:hypothetical protein